MDLWPQQQAAAWIPDLSLLACNSTSVCKRGCTQAATLWSEMENQSSFCDLSGLSKKLKKVPQWVRTFSCSMQWWEGVRDSLSSSPVLAQSAQSYRVQLAGVTRLNCSWLLCYPLFPLKGGYIFIHGSFSWLSLGASLWWIKINHF